MTDSGQSGGLPVKTYRVKDIGPVTIFPVTICDVNHNPLKSVEFTYVVDGSEESGITDDSGVLEVAGPATKTSITVSLPSFQATAAAGVLNLFIPWPAIIGQRLT